MKIPNSLRIGLVIWVLGLGILACSKGSSVETIQFPTKTPNSTQTPILVEITTTPNPTYTPIYVQVSNTPVGLVTMCVVADQAVNLRAAPNSDYYPIDPLSKGTRVFLTGSKDGSWVFVNAGNQSGWINSEFLGTCE